MSLRIPIVNTLMFPKSGIGLESGNSIPILHKCQLDDGK